MAAHDPDLAAWRDSLRVLGDALVDLEDVPCIVLARGGQLTGGSAAEWAAVDGDVAAAWTTFQAVTTLLDQIETNRQPVGATLAASLVDGVGGPADPRSAMLAARAATDRATALAARLSHAWEDLGRRVDAARASAVSSNDLATIRAAEALRSLLAHDPLAVTDADLTGVEAAADESARRRSAADTATARLDLDLLDATRDLQHLDADVQASDELIDRAVSRVAGLTRPSPVGDLTALADWLGRIKTMAAQDPTRAAATLDDWHAAAVVRRAELEAALAPLQAGLRRREQGRGLWTALRAKAAGRRLDEDQAVADALSAAKDLLWSAPCDLDAAEAALHQVATLLEPKDPSEATR